MLIDILQLLIGNLRLLVRKLIPITQMLMCMLQLGVFNGWVWAARRYAHTRTRVR